MVRTGFSAPKGSWNTIPTLARRKAAISDGRSPRMSRPSNKMRPEAVSPCGSRRMIEWQVMLLPLPLSPTRAK